MMIKRIFTDHPIMKMISICLAVLFWFVIRNEKQRELTVNIPVRYQNIPEGLIVTENPIDMIKLKLRGSKTRLAKMDDEFFSPYQINLEASVPGKNTFRVYPEDFKVPFGVVIDRIQPQIINLTMERLALKIIPIKPKTIGQPAQGYVVKTIRTIPSEIQLQSYDSQLKKIESFSTEPIQLSGHQKTFEGEFKIDSKGIVLGSNEQMVKVSVEIEEQRQSQTISSVPIRLGTQDEALMKKLRITFVPSTVSVRVSGPESRVAYLQKNPPQVIVNRKQWIAAIKSKKDSKIQLEVNKVEGVQLDIEPSAVKLVYPRKK